MSEYIKQNFVSGQILKAEHLNHMEDGISVLSEEKVNLPVDDLRGNAGDVLHSNGDGTTAWGAAVPNGSITFDKLAESTLETLGDGLMETGTTVFIDNKKDYAIVAEVTAAEPGEECLLMHSGKNLLDMSDKKVCNKNGDTMSVKILPALGMLEATVNSGNSVQRLVDKKIYIEPDKYYTYSGEYSAGGAGRLYIQAFAADGTVLSKGLTVATLTGGWAGSYLASYNGWYTEANPVKIKVDSTVAYIKLGAIWVSNVNGTDLTGTVQSYKHLQLEAGESQTDFSVGLQDRIEITNDVSYIDLLPGDNVLSADCVFSVRYNPYIRVPKNNTESWDYATPQMYGAKADGETDDTDAIQEALNNHKSVFFPEGKYLITSPLVVKSETVMFSDNAYDATIKAVGCDAIHLERGASGGVIKGIRFVGDESNHYCIVFNKNIWWTFERLHITYFGDSYFYADGNGFVSNIYITNCICMYGGTDCVHFQHVMVGIGQDEGSQINNVVVDKCLIEYFVTGITITGTAVVIRENVIEFCDNGIVVDTALSTRFSPDDIMYACALGMTIDANYMEKILNSCIYVNTLVNVDKSAYGFISGMSITGNYLRMHEDASAETAAIKFSRTSKIYNYNDYAVESYGREIDGVYARGNYYYLHKAFAIDCGGFLPSTCVFDIATDGGRPIREWIKNRGNATVVGWWLRKKKPLYMANGILSNGTANINGVTLNSGGEITIPANDVAVSSIDIHMSAESPANVSLKLYVVRNDTLERIKTVDTTITVETEATYMIDGNDIVTTDSDKCYYSDLASLELVISADSTVTINNPVVTHLA